MTIIHDGLSTYIIHYSPLTERLWHLKNSYLWHLLLPKVVTEKTIEEYRQLLPTSILSWPNSHVRAEILAQVTKIHPILLRNLFAIQNNEALEYPEPFRADSAALVSQIYPFYLQAISALSDKNYDLSCQHLCALIQFLRGSNHTCLILEDDSIACESNQEQFSIHLDHINKSAYTCKPIFIDISNSLNLRPKTGFYDQKFGFKKMTPGQTRCASSYLVNRAGAIKIIMESFPIVLPIDWHYSYVMSNHKINTYWSVSPVFYQGSQGEWYNSNQNNRNKL